MMPYRKKKDTACAVSFVCLLCVFHGLGFADDIDLDLAGVFQLSLDHDGEVLINQA